MTTDIGLRGLDLLDAALGHIEAHPETWKQRHYRCGSGMCLAGHIAVLAGGEWATAEPAEAFGHHGECMVLLDGEQAPGWEDAYPHIHVSDRAEHLIGVSRYAEVSDGEGVWEADLFDAGNTLDDLKRIRDHLRARAAAGAS